jgi:rod shape-determining protein MreC
MLVVTAVVLITLDARSEGGPLTSVRNVVLDVFGPVRSAADWVFSPLDNAWQGITSYDDLEAENAELRARLAEVESSILQVSEIESQRQELLALMNVQDTVPNIPRVTARVIDAPVSNFERTIELDRGSRNGVLRGMPVETGAGLIGRVVDVSSTRSRVELLTDPNFDVGVRMVRSGDDGSAAGRGRGEDLEVSFVELETVVIPGETVVTSGFQGSTFPEGLLVGTVVDVEPNAVQATQRITVRPAAELTRLRWVSVILFEPDAPEPVVVERTPETTVPVEDDTDPADTDPKDPTPGEPESTVPVESPADTGDTGDAGDAGEEPAQDDSAPAESGVGGDAPFALGAAIMAGVRPRRSPIGATT